MFYVPFDVMFTDHIRALDPYKPPRTEWLHIVAMLSAIKKTRSGDNMGYIGSVLLPVTSQ